VSERVSVDVVVNGERFVRDVEPRLLLVDFLRHDLGLHGTHVGCEQGVCGMCTLLVDGQPTKSCLMLAAQAHGATISTVESLAAGDDLHPLQAAFREAHALQCGYCTPGFLMTVYALGERLAADGAGAPLDRHAIREELAGVLCRCTGYDGIVAATESYLVQRVGNR
jgi:aerobic-type carbon monoxide dehydrogenase small subunit (CoxS/CutS family)